VRCWRGRTDAQWAFQDLFWFSAQHAPSFNSLSRSLSARRKKRARQKAAAGVCNTKQDIEPIWPAAESSCCGQGWTIAPFIHVCVYCWPPGSRTQDIYARGVRCSRVIAVRPQRVTAACTLCRCLAQRKTLGPQSLRWPLFPFSFLVSIFTKKTYIKIFLSIFL